MSTELQEGIYYSKKKSIGKSFAILFLRVNERANIYEAGKAINSLWDMYQGLKKGIVKGLNTDNKHRSSGNLSVLIGYGPQLFSLGGAKRKRPTDFDSKWLLKPPKPTGGGSVLEGSQISYSSETNENHVLYDHIAIQVIGEAEFYTNRAVVETWKELYRMSKESYGTRLMEMTRIYTGFQRPDGRNWLGFHDGVSNLKSMERSYVISINPNYLSSLDKWVKHGTYLAYFRIFVNLQAWEDIEVEKQEIMIGREKVSGCPIISIDEKGKPVKDKGCPVRGTTEVIDRGNEHFRDRLYDISRVVSRRNMGPSHIRMMRRIDKLPVWDKKSSRIFRQGFEFLEATDKYPYIRLGLNFVSFQNSPERLYKTLTNTYGKQPASTRSQSGSSTLNNFFSVGAAGVFLVPPSGRRDVFPGSSIFFESKNLHSPTAYH